MKPTQAIEKEVALEIKPKCIAAFNFAKIKPYWTNRVTLVHSLIILPIRQNFSL